MLITTLKIKTLKICEINHYGVKCAINIVNCLGSFNMDSQICSHLGSTNINKKNTFKKWVIFNALIAHYQEALAVRHTCTPRSF